MMNTDVRVSYLFRSTECKIDLRQSAFQLGQPRPLFAGRNFLLAGARRDGSFLGLACSRIETDLEDALEDCLGAFDSEGAEAAVAYSSRRGWVSLDLRGPERDALFATGRCLASGYGIHLVDWLLCGDGSPVSLRPRTDGDGDWWDVPLS
jgi:hypothetical protein